MKINQLIIDVNFELSDDCGGGDDDGDEDAWKMLLD